MRKKLHRRGWLTALLFAAALLLPMSQAYAEVGDDAPSTVYVPPQGGSVQSGLQTIDKNGNKVACGGGILGVGSVGGSVSAAEDGVLLGKIVPCMASSIESATIMFTQKMVDWLRPLLYTLLTLVIVLFGVRVLQGEPDMHKHGFLLLLKITLVLTILDSLSGFFVPQAYGIINQSVAVVTGALDNSSISCKISEYGGANTPKVWALMDCILGKLFGFSTGGISAGGVAGQANVVLATSMFGLLTGFLFGGAWGVVVFFGMLGVLFSVFMLVIRTALAFVNGYFTVCLMLILLPLLLPLVFLRVTQGYFEGVIKNILAGFILPVVVTAYAMMALVIYDNMLFAPNSLLQDLFKYDKIQFALQDSRSPCNREVTNDAGETRVGTGGIATDMNTLMKSKYLQNFIQPMLSGANDTCAGLAVPTFNVKDVNNPDYKLGKETQKKLFDELVQLLVLGILVAKGQEMLVSLLQNIVGASGVVRSMEAMTQQDIKFQNAANQAKNQFKEAVSGKSGADYLKSILGSQKDAKGNSTNAVNDAMKTFISGIRK